MAEDIDKTVPKTRFVTERRSEEEIDTSQNGHLNQDIDESEVSPSYVDLHETPPSLRGPIGENGVSPRNDVYSNFVSSGPNGLIGQIAVQEHQDQQALYNRIAYLETQLAERNRHLKDYESLRRTHDTALTSLIKCQAEAKILEASREEHFKLKEHFKAEHDKVLKENQKLKQLLRDKNATLSRVNAENEELRSARRLHQELQRVHGELANNDAVRPASFPQEIQQQSRIGRFSGIELRSNVTDQASTPVSKRKRFSCERSPLPQCKNCMTVFFDENQPQSVPCTFHRASPQPYAVWGKQLDPIDKSPDCKYWPCCEKISKTMPTGCLCLKHHDIVYPLEDVR